MSQCCRLTVYVFSVCVLSEMISLLFEFARRPSERQLSALNLNGQSIQWDYCDVKEQLCLSEINSQHVRGGRRDRGG